MYIGTENEHAYLNLLEHVVDFGELRSNRRRHQGCLRKALTGPRLIVDPDVKEIDDFRADHIQLAGYQPHPPIKASVAV